MNSSINVLAGDIVYKQPLDQGGEMEIILHIQDNKPHPVYLPVRVLKSDYTAVEQGQMMTAFGCINSGHKDLFLRASLLAG